MTDIQTKYQILAAEYAKLKEQVQILKHAVRSEQAKEEELKGTLQEKERNLRKTEQELESLVFRNKQLSSRVEVLQQELEASASAKNKKSKNTSQAQSSRHTDFENSVISEELQKKIEENATLHKQVFDSTQKHRSEVSELEEKLMRLEEEAGRHQHVLSALQTKNKEAVEKLLEEKALLQAKLHNHQTETKDAQQRAQKAEETLEVIEKDLGGRLEDASEIIRVKLPFNDLNDRSLGALNVPSHQRSQQVRSKELVVQAGALVKQLTQALSNFYTYSEQRAATYPLDSQLEALSDVNKKLCQHLHENASPLRQVEQSFQEFAESLDDDIITTLETASGLREFASSWHQFVLYASKLLPYQLLSLVEECRVSTCTESLEKKNMELHSGLQAFMAVLNKLDTYITMLAKYSGHTGCDLPKSSQSSIFRLLATTMETFHTLTKELSQHFNAKISIEHQLPTASKKLKITDECIVSALISLVTCTGKLEKYFTENVEFVCECVGNARPIHPAVASFHRRNAAYIASLNRPMADSVPHATAMHNRQTLFSSTESQGSLTAQVVGFQERTQKLEKEREHWMLEAQLQQVKYDMQAKRMGELEKQVERMEERLSAGVLHDTPGSGDGQDNPPPPAPDAPGVAPGVVGGCSREEQDVRERLIKEYYRQRIDQLFTQLQMADSKALHFEAECRALHKRLTLAQKERNLTDANQEILQLKDELATTKRNYESQLSMMSEHLAGMNEKLSTQTDEISALKYQLQTKGDKKLLKRK